MKFVGNVSVWVISTKLSNLTCLDSLLCNWFVNVHSSLHSSCELLKIELHVMLAGERSLQCRYVPAAFVNDMWYAIFN